MSDMVERIALALADSFKATVAGSSGKSFEASGVALPANEIWQRYARAAIEAMRVPTPLMRESIQSALHAAALAIDGPPKPEDECTTDDCWYARGAVRARTSDVYYDAEIDAAWNAGIDAALR